MVDEEKTVAPKRPDQSRLKVTKEELDESGLSLRDFMNKKQGLKRRDGSAPAAKTSSSGPSATPSAGSQMGPGSSATKAMESEKPREDFAGIKNMLSERQKRIARDKAALESSYKAGGSVSSASSRADGCAQRGKTKGTMIMNRGGMAC